MGYEVEKFKINGAEIDVIDNGARAEVDEVSKRVGYIAEDIVDIEDEIKDIHSELETTLHLRDIVDNLFTDDASKVLSARQGKILDDKVDECFQSVSNGKRMIADAITDKGIETSATDTFEQMADNILAIPTGGGDIEVMEYTDTMYIYFDEIEVIE